jgi:hypothetical protein
MVAYQTLRRVFSALQYNLSSTHVGLAQEEIICSIIVSNYTAHLGQPNHCHAVFPVKQKLLWTSARTYEVNWYEPNMHPIKVNAISRPEFDIIVDGKRLINIESKNWKTNYKPLSLATTQNHIISRFKYQQADKNILIITELRLENQSTTQIQNLLNQYNVQVMLTHRQATSSTDAQSQAVIQNQLQPILLDILSK